MKVVLLIKLIHLLTLACIGESNEEEEQTKLNYTKGCLHTKSETKYKKKRVCNSDDSNNTEKSLLCDESVFDYPEIRIHNGDWDSSIVLAWIYQIVLMELARVPVTVGHKTNSTAKSSFYSSKSTIEYSEVSYDWDGLRKGNSGQDGKMLDCSSTDEACSHFLPEVWEGQNDKYNEWKADGIISRPVSYGLYGKMGLYIPSITAKKYPGLSIWYGLSGEENRKQLAETFRRPTSWKDYCDTISRTKCTTSDDTASRYPMNKTEEESYFMEGNYTGYFEYTHENNCTMNPTNCTGELIGCPCDWSVNIESQIYWNDIVGLSSKKYNSSQLKQIWHAAHATKSDVIMCWFEPDPLPYTYFGTNYSFIWVDFPSTSDECLENKQNKIERCSDNFKDKIGNSKDACSGSTQSLKYAMVKSLEESNHQLDPVYQSPAAEILRNLQLSNVDLGSILRSWQRGKDPREAVCDWISENADYIVDNFFPKGYPREFIDSTDGNLKWYHYIAQIFAFVALIASILSIFLIWNFRKTKTMVFAQPVFLLLILSGFFVTSIGSFFFSLNPTDISCAVSRAFLMMGFTVVLVPIIVKTSAINQILRTATKKNKRVNISRRKLLRRVAVILALVIIFLIVWHRFDPPIASTERILLSDEKTIVLDEKRCVGENPTNYMYWGSAWYAWDLMLMIVLSILAYQNKNVMEELNESHSLNLMIYSLVIAHFLRILVFLANTNRMIENEKYRAVKSLIISLGALISMGVYVFPKIIDAMRNSHDFEESRLQDFSSTKEGPSSSQEIHDLGGLHVLVCTANLGNAKPTPESMEAWIPLDGQCSLVTPLDTVESMPDENFDLIAIGMQEATWKRNVGRSQSIVENDMSAEDLLQSFENECTAKLRTRIQTILGEEYYPLVTEERGQMRFYLWARHNVVGSISDVKVRGANTGVGNVLANKGGIVTSLNYESTRISFVSAHLTAHEGASNYKSRCDNMRSILRENTKMFGIGGKKNDIDITVSSHHMFVLGDLNFRTKFEANTHEERFERAKTLVEFKDYLGLYEFDELKDGLINGDLLTDFKTLPCDFPPTFKVSREPGFVYLKQRVPSYTDRIIFKSSEGLSDNLEKLAYEPCVDFITSDHKPIRGAFRITTNASLDSLHLRGKYHVTLSQMRCRNLRKADRNGFSDPYLKFLFESCSLTMETNSIIGKLRSFRSSREWLRTDYISRTLNPHWGDTTLSFSISDCEIKPGQMLFVGAMNHDMIGKEVCLGGVAISLKELFTFENAHQKQKIQNIERSLIWEGKGSGTVEFKVTITKS